MKIKKFDKMNENIGLDIVSYDDMLDLLTDGQIQVFNKKTGKKTWVDLDSLLYHNRLLDNLSKKTK